MKFKDWLKLQEVGTGTSAIAVFSRPMFSDPIERLGPLPLVFSIGGHSDDEHDHHHKHKKRKKKK